MSAWRLDLAKLADDVDRARRAGTPEEMSYRQVARLVGVSPDVFTRLNGGQRMDVDALCSLLMWIDPEAQIADYTLPGARRSAPRRLTAARP